MHTIPPLAWAAIILVIVMIIVTNLSLVALLRSRNRLPSARSNRTRMARDLQRFSSTLRNPFGEEKKQLQELSTRVEKLRGPQTQGQVGEPPPSDSEQ